MQEKLTKENATEELNKTKEVVENLKLKIENPEGLEKDVEEKVLNLKNTVEGLNTKITVLEKQIADLPESDNEAEENNELKMIMSEMASIVSSAEGAMQAYLEVPVEVVENKETEENKTKSIEPLEYFKGDEKAMKKYFSELSREYSTTLPVEHSVIRTEQQNKLLKDLESGVPVVIEAHKRQGKTSMLKSLGNVWKEKNGTEPIYIDMNKRDIEYKDLSAEEFKGEVGKEEIEYFFEDNFPDFDFNEISKEMEGKTPFEILDAFLEKNGEGKQFLIEVDELIETAKKNDGRLESLAESLKNLKNVKVLLAWHPFDIYSDQAKSAFKDYERTPIKPLDVEDAKILIEKPLKDKGSDISFSDEAIQKIYDYAGGRPMDMNLFCGQLTGGTNFDAVQKMRYEKTDIEEFINKNNLNELHSTKDIFAATYDDIPKIYMYDLNKEHKDAINTLVKAGGEVQVSDITEQNGQDLINLGFVNKDEKNNTYKIKGEVVFNLFKQQVDQAS